MASELTGLVGRKRGIVGKDYTKCQLEPTLTKNRSTSQILSLFLKHPREHADDVRLVGLVVRHLNRAA